MRDAPQPSYVRAIQKLLSPGEVWNLTAPVFATVAAYDHSKATTESSYEEFFYEFCQAAIESSGAYAHMSMMNDKSLSLLSPVSYSNQSLQFVGITDDPGIEYEVSCEDFYPHAVLFSVNRQLCEGKSSITRGGL
ncbi:hypothetical protein H2198_005650 [Neophaeococcomyces mojaviensis]|uniref:Uncharacterized protein n=1 Tax=Neophaeococcomyces mojaviensis TaxID=3383035 RepID=A0ACC3A4Z1_9EURO|nr:hypothetical protein H2198_005650 [Knufia sp. JES_112]